VVIVGDLKDCEYDSFMRMISCEPGYAEGDGLVLSCLDSVDASALELFGDVVAAQHEEEVNQYK